jgi:hypothetical protein
MRKTNESEVLAVIKAHGGAIGPAAIAREVGCARSTAHRYLAEWRNERGAHGVEEEDAEEEGEEAADERDDRAELLELVAELSLENRRLRRMLRGAA